MCAVIGWLMLLFFHLVSGNDSLPASFEPAVRVAVENQMRDYPESTLKDLYKNFFQDRFGPGHLIADTTGSGRYLRRELASYTECSGAIAEPAGWEGNYLRVNLSVLKERKIPYDIFFDAFVRSVNSIEPPAIEAWTEEWKRIEAVIRRMNLSLPDYESDRAAIEVALKRGEYVGHHSAAFEKAYTPHYRIIGREIFEKELLPYLKDE